MHGPRPICADCIHVSEDLETCTPFPNGIPAEILQSKKDHRVPFEGDGDVQFLPIEGSELTGDPEQPIPWLVIQPGGETDEED